jgi:two-component system CheB/CheR fusion protein
LIGVTNFFRDPVVWEKMKTKVIPDILSKLQPGSVIRVWVPGCSTGEEAYSLAIVFIETLEMMNPRGDFSLQVFATDLDAEAIEIARRGLYPLNIATDVSQDRLNRYFLYSEDGYRIKPEIREMVVFATHNIILHPPFTRIDILSCRNLLIYMDQELQKKLIGLFYYSVNNEGIMLLGGSETLGNQSNLFVPVDSKLKIYRKAVTSQMPELKDFPSSFSRSKTNLPDKPQIDRSVMNIQTLSDQLLLKDFTPPSVLVNEFGDIIYIHGHTGKYLEPAVGKANLNIFAMLREGLRNDFLPSFRRAVNKKETVILNNVKIGTNGHTQILNIEIKWIDKPELLYGTLMIVFKDAKEIPEIHTDPRHRRKVLTTKMQKELEDELHSMREEMQNTLEEVQTSQEELRSTNEELQSTNEELQSTNEELTTSKEEMQSLNEELQTVNAELQAKVEDFSRVNNDMKNLLNSTEIATLFLDKELNIRRYTMEATKIFKLIKSDIGRPFTDQVSDLVYPTLVDDTIEVLRTLIFLEKQIPTRDGRWFLIRIMPYRTFDDRIDGLVITFINITDHKKIEERLQQAENLNRYLLRDSRDIIIVLSAEFIITGFNPGAVLFFGKKQEDCLNKSFIELFIPDKLQKKTEKCLTMYLKNKQPGELIIKVITTNLKGEQEECNASFSINNLETEKGIILSIKKDRKNE